MKLKHIDPMGAGRIAALGMRLVDRDEVVDVPEDVAPLLVIQTLNWQPADKAAEKLAATAIPEHLAELAALDPAVGEEERLALTRADMQKGEKLSGDLEDLRHLWEGSDSPLAALRVALEQTPQVHVVVSQGSSALLG